MSDKVLNIIKDKNIIIPLYIYKLRKKLDIKLEAFIFLMYLYSYGKKTLFDLSLFSNDLDMLETEVLKELDYLIEKALVELELVKNDKGVIEEYIKLDLFYEKINLSIIELVSDKEPSLDIFSDIEREFGRTLSPIETEIIKGWLEAKFSEEMIRLALKEASFNGVNNLKYIDRILFEWDKLNLKSKVDVEEHLTKRKKKSESEKKPEVFDYDWLASDE